MTDPVTGAISKVAVSKVVELGKGIYDKANGARSSVKMSKAVAELEAEHAAEQDHQAQAAAVGEDIARVHLALLEQHRWEGEPEDERPTWDDVASASVDLIRQARRAGSNKKREVLFRAFYMQFDPEFYKTGMGRLLWSIACELEYPTMRALREVAEAERLEAIARQARSARITPPGARIDHTAQSWPHLAWLGDHGLVYTIERPDMTYVQVTRLGHAFIRFALEEYREQGDAEG